jgi:hypothetical protein
VLHWNEAIILLQQTIKELGQLFNGATSVFFLGSHAHKLASAVIISSSVQDDKHWLQAYSW